MVVGASNSMTYLSPKHWWDRLLPWLGKCQEVDYVTQYYKYGTRFFDIRLGVTKNMHMIVKNGAIEYTTFSLYEVFDYFNKHGGCTVRVTLDETFEESMALSSVSEEKKFKEFCEIIESTYKDVNLCGGYRSFDKKVLYSFTSEKVYGSPCLIDPSEWSMLYRVVRRWFPFLIRKMNASYIERFDNEHGFLVLSYVNRR